MLAQEPGCAAIAAATARADVFDLRGAMQRLEAAITAGCPSAQVQATYLRGWLAARDAYRAGGSPESLTDVDAAVASLSAAGEKLAADVLQAAVAAAQSERESLSLFIEQAVQLEAVRLSARLSGAPIITAHEAAGDLWLQVHRYEDARRAYQRAAERIGTTPRVTVGLARAAARLKDAPEACRQYQTLDVGWREAGTEPQEIIEAREFLRSSACPPPAAGR
jgi:tetratricopeptide (TPR) repeat protein